MKNCKTCNAALEDTAIFCVMCGAKAEDGVETNLTPPPVPSNIDYAAVLTSDSSKDSPRQVFFNATSSVKALIAVILLSVAFLFSVANVAISLFTMSSSDLRDQFMASLLDGSSIDPIIAASFASGFTIGFNIMLVAMLIPSTLTVLGVIFTYINSKKHSLDTKGLTFMKATSIFTLVLYGLVLALLVVASLGVPYGIIVVIIGGVIGFAIPVIIQIFFLTTIDRMKNVVHLDQNLNISTFVPVIMIIGCGFSALTVISSGDIFSILLGGVGLVGNILFAICLFDYNNALALMRVKNIYDKPTNRGNGL